MLKKRVVENIGPITYLFIVFLFRLLFYFILRFNFSMATIDADNQREIARLPTRPVMKKPKRISIHFSFLLDFT
jgi:hypothetical protein